MPNIPCLSEFKAFKLAQESRVSALELSNTSGVAKYVPASGIQAGTLPSGVTIGSSQVDGLNTAIQTTLASASINTSQITNLCPAVQNCLSTATINANNITGTLPSGVLINDTSNFGVGAISTDSNRGVSRSATVAETGAGVLNNGVHTSPADLVSAINAPAVGGVFNPLQMSVRGQIPYYLFSKQTITSGTDRQEVIVDLNGKLWAGYKIYGTNLLPPTLAPNDNNSTVIPKAATVVATSSGDTYIWNGVVWVNISSTSVQASGIVGLDSYIAAYLLNNPPLSDNKGKIVMVGYKSPGSPFVEFQTILPIGTTYKHFKYNTIQTVSTLTYVTTLGSVGSMVDVFSFDRIATIVSPSDVELGLCLYTEGSF